MMSPVLNNFTIHNEGAILLSFRDGRKLLVEVDDLPVLVSIEDLRSIHEALRMRTSYIQKNLPTWAKVVVLAAIGFVFVAPTVRAAQTVMHMVQVHTSAKTSVQTPTTPVAQPNEPSKQVVNPQPVIIHAAQPTKATSQPSTATRHEQAETRVSNVEAAPPVKQVINHVEQTAKPVTDTVEPLAHKLGL